MLAPSLLQCQSSPISFLRAVRRENAFYIVTRAHKRPVETARHSQSATLHSTGNISVEGSVVDTGDKFDSNVVGTGDSLSLVSLTPLINIPSRLSPRIFERSRTIPRRYSGAQGTLIHEKKLSWKSRVRLSLMCLYLCICHSLAWS